jgi:GABA permease
MEHTYRVIRLVATSTDSWEQAARNGVAEAAKTIDGLRQARVTAMDAVVRDGTAGSFRLELEVELQLDRSRPSHVAGQPNVTVKRYLIVANETLAGDRIPALVAKRMAAGPAEFHVLVPASRSRETRRLAAVAGDPLSGYAMLDVVGLEEARAKDRADAEARLASFVERLEDLGASYTSEIGSPDPFHAVARVMERASFDEIIISTLPSSISRWLRLDLPSRVQRAHAVPVVTITVDR